jgi:hypothetical protein
MIELIAVHEPETKMIPTYNNRMIGTYQKRGESAQPLPVPPPEKPSLIKRLLKWIKK